MLSVAIPTGSNGRSREQVIRQALETAVAHADGEEWTERPDYQNGLKGLELWALVLDRWALIVGAGRGHRIPPEIPDRAAYYAVTHYSARCYARDYIAAIAGGDEKLELAAKAYGRVASHLRPVWEAFPSERRPSADLLTSLADSIRSARVAEELAIDGIREYLARHPVA